MKKQYKLIISLLVMLLLVSTFTLADVQAKGKKASKSSVSYTLKNGTLTVKGKGAIPGDMTFKNNKKIKKVVIKKGITEIPDDAFYGCKNLKSVKLPSTLKTIGSYAFYNTSIQNLTIPKSVETIGMSAFKAYGKNKTIAKVKMPGKFKTKVEEREETDLSTASVYARNIEFTTAIDPQIFASVNAEFYKVSKKDKNYSSKDGIIYNKDFTETVLLPNRKKVEIDSRCTTFDIRSAIIGDVSHGKYYLRNNKIKEIVLPSSVTKIVNTEKNIDMDDMIFAESTYNIKKIVIQNPDIEEESYNLLKTTFYGLKEKKTKKMIVLSR